VLVVSDLFALLLPWLLVAVGLHRYWGEGFGLAMMGGIGLVIFGLALMRYSGLHSARSCAMRSVELTKLARVATWSAAAAYAVGLVPRDHAWVAAVAGGLTFSTLAIERSLYRTWVGSLRRRGRSLRRVLVLGPEADAETIVSLTTNSPELGYQVCGVVRLGANDDRAPADGEFGLAGRVLDEARALDVSGLIVATGAVSPAETVQLVRCATTMGLHVQVWGGLPGIDQRRLRPMPLGHQPGFYLAPPTVSSWQKVAKRLVDLTVAPLLLLLTAPVILVTVVLIKLEDHGPIVFRQRRIGKDGREFMLYKFRSMVVDAEARLPELLRQNERSGPLFKVQVDPRTTRIGRFLRATSIDELPQLINVVRGEMTLVGPRPALADEVAQFDEELLRRLRVTPGVTGLWQVEARDNPSFDAYRSLDLFYVDNWSLGIDLAILASTAAVVLGRSLRSLRLQPEQQVSHTSSLAEVGR
jgi:exopolysaccharide biosynthesis polyprenyl glycosylphosphotransferase